MDKPDWTEAQKDDYRVNIGAIRASIEGLSELGIHSPGLTKLLEGLDEVIEEYGDPNE